MDTIFALSSGTLPAGVAVIRLSGRGTQAAVRRLLGRLPAPRVATYGVIRGRDGAELDRGLTLWFPGPASFTGEDCAEFHLHGGRAVVQVVVACLTAIQGLRPAEAGEFSRRAFLNGKIDLTAVEGLADLISAETESQRRLALRQSSGSTGAILEQWRGRLIRMRALIEAELDFPDEEDVPGSVSDAVWSDAAELINEMRRHLDRATRGERARVGLEVVIMGPPNAGKSSLLNALARREAAIVTPEAGTTRDLIEVRMDLGGYPVTLVDTAGLREAAGMVEAEGIRRARDRGAGADLLIWLTPADESAVAAMPERSDRMWRVVSKTDLVAAAGNDGADFHLSTRTGEGLLALEVALQQLAERELGGAEDLVITRSRHRLGLEACCRHLQAALTGERSGLELRAEDLRLAADALGRLTGRVDVEDLLDVIFRDFCIGK